MPTLEGYFNNMDQIPDCLIIIAQLAVAMPHLVLSLGAPQGRTWLPPTPRPSKLPGEGTVSSGGEDMEGAAMHILEDYVYSHCSSCSSSKWSSSSLAGEAELGARGSTGFSPSALAGGQVSKGRRNGQRSGSKISGSTRG